MVIMTRFSAFCQSKMPKFFRYINRAPVNGAPTKDSFEYPNIDQRDLK
jgi:hypothetical protein